MGGTNGVDGSDGADGSDGTGRIVVKLTDLPVSDATALLVRFSDLSVHMSGGGWVTLSEMDLTCDLLRLQNGVTDNLVEGPSLEAGTLYTDQPDRRECGHLLWV